MNERSTEDQNYRNLLINGAWFGLIDGGIVTYLPVFLARLGASASMVGLLTSGPSLLGILSYITGGAYAQRQRDMVKVAVRSSLLVRISYPLIALLPLFLGPAAIPLVAVVLWSLLTLPNGVYVPAWTTVMQQAVSRERRAQLNGTRWAIYSLVSAVTIAALGFLLDHVAFPHGYQVVFLVSFVGGLANAYYFSRIKIPPFENRDAQAGRGTLLDQLRTFFQPLTDSPAFLRYNLATLPFRLIQNMPIALYSIYWVRSLNAADTWIGLRGTVGYAALVIGYRTWGRVANRLGHRRLLVICGIGFALYPVVTALSNSVELLLPAAVIWGIFVSGTDIGFFDMLLTTCPQGRQPAFAATSNMLVSLVAFIAPLIGAWLSQALDIRAALFITGACQLVSVVFFRLLPNREQESLPC